LHHILTSCPPGNINGLFNTLGNLVELGKKYVIHINYYPQTASEVEALSVTR
jgi:hypothetical protein